MNIIMLKKLFILLGELPNAIYLFLDLSHYAQSRECNIYTQYIHTCNLYVLNHINEQDI